MRIYLILGEFIIVSSVYAFSISVEPYYFMVGFLREFLADPQKEIETRSHHQLDNESGEQIQDSEIGGESQVCRREWWPLGGRGLNDAP